MWTGKKESVRENAEYTAQIYPYHGRIYVEILNKKYSNDSKLDLYLTIIDKSFGRSYNSPREKDWKAAHEWMNEQMNLIDKYGTSTVRIPEVLREIMKQI